MKVHIKINGCEIKQVPGKNNRLNREWLFWQKLNHMNHRDYIRAQKLCIRYLGGRVNGFSLNGIIDKYGLNIE